MGIFAQERQRVINPIDRSIFKEKILIIKRLVNKYINI